jgi:hypothetical protein
VASEKAEPAGVSGGLREMLVSDWKAHEKNTLRGFLSLTLPSGLVIHNCTFHRKNGARWIGLPARQYAKDDGTAGWQPIVGFLDEIVRAQFQADGLAALDRYFAGHGNA